MATKRRAYRSYRRVRHSRTLVAVGSLDQLNAPITVDGGLERCSVGTV